MIVLTLELIISEAIKSYDSRSVRVQAGNERSVTQQRTFTNLAYTSIPERNDAASHRNSAEQQPLLGGQYGAVEQANRDPPSNVPRLYGRSEQDPMLTGYQQRDATNSKV